MTDQKIIQEITTHMKTLGEDTVINALRNMVKEIKETKDQAKITQKELDSLFGGKPDLADKAIKNIGVSLNQINTVTKGARKNFNMLADGLKAISADGLRQQFHSMLDLLKENGLEVGNIKRYIDSIDFKPVTRIGTEQDKLSEKIRKTKNQLKEMNSEYIKTAGMSLSKTDTSFAQGLKGSATDVDRLRSLELLLEKTKQITKEGKQQETLSIQKIRNTQKEFNDGTKIIGLKQKLDNIDASIVNKATKKLKTDRNIFDSSLRIEDILKRKLVLSNELVSQERKRDVIKKRIVSENKREYSEQTKLLSIRNQLRMIDSTIVNEAKTIVQEEIKSKNLVATKLQQKQRLLQVSKELLKDEKLINRIEQSNLRSRRSIVSEKLKESVLSSKLRSYSRDNVIQAEQYVNQLMIENGVSLSRVNQLSLILNKTKQIEIEEKRITREKQKQLNINKQDQVTNNGFSGLFSRADEINKARAKALELSRNLKSTGEAGNKGFNRITASAKKANIALDGTKKKIREIETATGLTTSKVRTLFVWLTRGFIAFQLVKGLNRWAIETERASQAMKQFQQLGDFEDLNKQLDQIADVTGGLVGRFEMMPIINKGVTLGLDLTKGKMLELVSATTKLAQKFGIDAKKAAEDFMVGVSKASPLIMDNVGILLKREQAYMRYYNRLETETRSYNDWLKTINQEKKNQIYAEEGIREMKRLAGGFVVIQGKYSASVKKMEDAWKSFSMSMQETGIINALEWFIKKAEKALSVLTRMSNLVKYYTTFGDIDKEGAINLGGGTFGEQEKEFKKYVEARKIGEAEIKRAENNREDMEEFHSYREKELDKLYNKLKLIDDKVGSDSANILEASLLNINEALDSTDTEYAIDSFKELRRLMSKELPSNITFFPKGSSKAMFVDVRGEIENVIAETYMLMRKIDDSNSLLRAERGMTKSADMFQQDTVGLYLISKRNKAYEELEGIVKKVGAEMKVNQDAFNGINREGTEVLLMQKQVIEEVAKSDITYGLQRASSAKENAKELKELRDSSLKESIRNEKFYTDVLEGNAKARHGLLKNLTNDKVSNLKYINDTFSKFGIDINPLKLQDRDKAILLGTIEDYRNSLKLTESDMFKIVKLWLKVNSEATKSGTALITLRSLLSQLFAQTNKVVEQWTSMFDRWRELTKSAFLEGMGDNATKSLLELQLNLGKARKEAVKLRQELAKNGERITNRDFQEYLDNIDQNYYKKISELMKKSVKNPFEEDYIKNDLENQLDSIKQQMDLFSNNMKDSFEVDLFRSTEVSKDYNESKKYLNKLKGDEIEKLGVLKTLELQKNEIIFKQKKAELDANRKKELEELEKSKLNIGLLQLALTGVASIGDKFWKSKEPAIFLSGLKKKADELNKTQDKRIDLTEEHYRKELSNIEKSKLKTDEYAKQLDELNKKYIPLFKGSAVRTFEIRMDRNADDFVKQAQDKANKLIGIDRDWVERMVGDTGLDEGRRFAKDFASGLISSSPELKLAGKNISEYIKWDDKTGLIDTESTKSALTALGNIETSDMERVVYLLREINKITKPLGKNVTDSLKKQSTAMYEFIRNLGQDLARDLGQAWGNFFWQSAIANEIALNDMNAQKDANVKALAEQFRAGEISQQQYSEQTAELERKLQEDKIRMEKEGLRTALASLGQQLFSKGLGYLIESPIRAFSNPAEASAMAVGGSALMGLGLSLGALAKSINVPPSTVAKSAKSEEKKDQVFYINRNMYEDKLEYQRALERVIPQTVGGF